MATPRVFVSMGTPYNAQFEQFRDSLETFLRDQCKVDPRIIGKNEYPDGNPLTKIREVMGSCHGVIVVAYERKFLQEGQEKRTGENPKLLSERTYTTPWNHIESAMAYSLGLPLYIVCQRGLTEEGLIESKLDWYVQHVDMNPATFSEPAIAQSIKGWIEARVRPNSNAPRLIRSLQGSMKLSEMTPKEMTAAISVVVGAFGLGVVAANLFPKLFA